MPLFSLVCNISTLFVSLLLRARIVKMLRTGASSSISCFSVVSLSFEIPELTMVIEVSD